MELKRSKKCGSCNTCDSGYQRLIDEEPEEQWFAEFFSANAPGINSFVRRKIRVKKTAVSFITKEKNCVTEETG